MFRMFRYGMSYGLLTGLVALLLCGPIGCSGGGPTTCTAGSCPAGQTCNTTTGQCEGGSGTTCTTAADCGTNKVCDNGRCYNDCTVDGFAGCDPGNTCDETGSKRCKCDTAACANQNNSGCHPVRMICDNYCDPASTSDCTGNEKCVPLATDATKGFCQEAKSCTADADCTAENPKCDTAKGFCVPGAPKCTSDANCAGNANGTHCDTASGNCVKCTEDSHCDTTKQETCNKTTFTCEAPQGCQNSKACYDATPRTYCGTKGSPCNPAPERTCANMVDSEKDKNAGWETNNEAMVIWGLQEVERKTTNNCVSGGSGTSCTSDADCSGGEICAGFDSKCHNKLTNGEVVLKFNFYAPKGIKQNYTSGSGNFMSGTSVKPDFGWADLATKLAITAGDANEGEATISVCESKGPYKGWFIFNDTADKPSNAACVDISARN